MPGFSLLKRRLWAVQIAPTPHLGLRAAFPSSCSFFILELNLLVLLLANEKKRKKKTLIL